MQLPPKPKFSLLWPKQDEISGRHYIYLNNSHANEYPNTDRSVIINIIPRNDSDLNIRGLFRALSIIYDEAFCENS